MKAKVFNSIKTALLTVAGYLWAGGSIAFLFWLLLSLA